MSCKNISDSFLGFQMEEACEAMLAGPHSFPLNRLLAIFSSLLSTSVDDCSQVCRGRTLGVFSAITYCKSCTVSVLDCWHKEILQITSNRKHTFLFFYNNLKHCQGKN